MLMLEERPRDENTKSHRNEQKKKRERYGADASHSVIKKKTEGPTNGVP